MIYQGLHIDVLALWESLVDLPNGLADPLPTYLPKVQCPNPAHQTSKSHFQINTRQPVVHCFANCGISGTYEHAIAMIYGWKTKNDEWDFKRARKEIFKASRIPLKGDLPSSPGTNGKRKTLNHESEVAKDQRALESGAFTYLPKSARAYLDRRGIEPESRGKWEIGWDEEHDRLTLPAYDERGTFRFLVRARIDGRSRAKYLYTSGAIKTSLLYGACFAARETLDSFGLVLCEGPLDAIRLQQAGVTTATAILGSGLSEKQLRIMVKLSPRRVYLFFDRDYAGFTNIVRSLKMHNPAPLYVALYPKGKNDPAELTRKEVDQSLGTAIPMAKFIQKTRNVALMKEAVNGENLYASACNV